MRFKNTLHLCAFVLICILTGSVVGQTRTSEFVNAKARFALAISGEPTERQDKDLSLVNCELHGESFVWKGPESYTEVQQYSVYCAAEKVSPAEKKALLDALKKGFIDAFAKGNLTTQEAVFTDGVHTGPEIRAIGAGRLITRIFFHGERLYILSFMRRDMTLDELATATKAFRILPEDEHIAALMVACTPKPLPQDASSKVVSPDIKNEGLKGRVKTVIAETQEGSKPKRLREYESYYDDAGNLLKRISYTRGYPTDVNVWGWIDGKRVMNFEMIEYGAGEGPIDPRSEIIATMVEAPSSEPQPQPKRDERYSYSYVYRYDDAMRLVETKILENDGSLWQSISVSYKPGQRERAMYDEESKLDSRTVEILDGDGNVIEERAYNHRGVLEGIVVYSYEFDQVGNWITKREFKKLRGKASATPSSTRYRAITYY